MIRHCENRSRRTSLRNTNAFTLIELMVAMGVLAVLVLLLASMVDASTKLWRQSENRVDSYREARAALNVIVNDLAGMYVSANTNYFNFTAGNDGTMTFLTALPSESQEESKNKSDLCEVTYERRKGRTTTKTAESFNLYRGFRSSDDTFEKLKTPGTFTGDAPEEVLARNIVEFNIEAYSLDRAGAATKFDQKNAKTPIPDLLVVKLVAINQDTAAKLKTNADWANKATVLYRNNQRTFTARVRLRTTGINFASPTPTPVPTPTPTPTPVPKP